MIWPLTNVTPVNLTPRRLVVRAKKCGSCLGNAPQIDAALFHGRSDELEKLKSYLLDPDTRTSRRCIVLGGIGGIGKTQLALAFAERYRVIYDSIFWLNANNEATLKASFRGIAEVVFEGAYLGVCQDEEILLGVRQYLSHPDNGRWLLIYDNYDNPDSYAIENYYPAASHGAIIVTSRLMARVNGVHLPIEPIKHIEDGIAILRTRSRRANVSSGESKLGHLRRSQDVDVRADLGAHRLAERLAGLPLALATAGAYLENSTWTFQRYLDEYEKRWNVNPRTPARLPDYHNRTLYTTWDLSYAQLETQDLDVAKLLALLAYFGNQKLWYELFATGHNSSLPDWLSRFPIDAVEWENMMNVLVQYCFIEVHETTETYSMHNCVHDWTLAKLNATINASSYSYAYSCVVMSVIDDERDQWSHIRYASLAQHAAWLAHPRFVELGAVASVIEYRHRDTLKLADLLRVQILLPAAEQMYLRALAGCEKAQGQDHCSTFDIINNLGALYEARGKLEPAEQMYMRALVGYEKALGTDHIATLDTVNSLGALYAVQGRFERAEQMYLRALAGREKTQGKRHHSTLDTVNNLGSLYRTQGKYEQAEQMYLHALAGYEEALGQDNISTLIPVNNLGNLYTDQGRYVQAEQLFGRALAGYERTLGHDHSLTLSTVHNLGNLYIDQGKFMYAERMYLRALAGYERILGPEHSLTLNTVNNLGVLYEARNEVEQAEQMYLRALKGYERSLGSEHSSTLSTINNLGILYRAQGKFEQAEQMYVRALAAYERTLGPAHTSTLDTVNNLGVLYRSQGKLEQAEQMYLRALTGREKALGRDHSSTLSTVHNLGNLYTDQGRYRDAEQMYERALSGFEEALGHEHPLYQRTSRNFELMRQVRDDKHYSPRH